MSIRVAQQILDAWYWGFGYMGRVKAKVANGKWKMGREKSDYRRDTEGAEKRAGPFGRFRVNEPGPYRIRRFITGVWGWWWMAWRLVWPRRRVWRRAWLGRWRLRL